jgi:hypothetical protein
MYDLPERGVSIFANRDLVRYGDASLAGRPVWSLEGARKGLSQSGNCGSDFRSAFWENPVSIGTQTQVAQNFAERTTSDPDARCFQPGVPRATLFPYPFQILQIDRAVYIVYERMEQVNEHSVRCLDGRSFLRGI